MRAEPGSGKIKVEMDCHARHCTYRDGNLTLLSVLCVCIYMTCPCTPSLHIPSLALLLSVCATAWLSAPNPAQAAPAPEEAWLDSLYERVATDVSAGAPIVVQAHVPLCDNNIIRCGRYGLGDGENPDKNLYWATSGGFRGWFKRKDRGWKQVQKSVHSHPDILEVMVWKQRFRASKAWRARGVTKSFAVYVVAFAWRGSAIRSAMDAYADDLFGTTPRVVTLADGTEIQAGGAAHVVSYVGHNGWMDVDSYDWPEQSRAPGADTAGTLRKGTIAVACITADYLAKDVVAEARVPLLMTRTLLFAGAHSFEGAVASFARGGSLRRIRKEAVQAYATGQGKTVKRVGSAFTNPSDKRWRYTD